MRGNALRYREELSSRDEIPHPLRRCLLGVAHSADNGSTTWIGYFRELRAIHGATPCVSFGLTRALKAHPLTRRQPVEEELAMAREAAGAFPGHHEVLTQLVTSLERLGRVREARTVATQGAVAAPHILHRQALQFEAAYKSLKLADSAAAAAIADSSEVEARRDGRPWVLFQFTGKRRGLSVALGPDSEGYAAEQLSLARASGLRAVHVRLLVSRAGVLVEAGRIREALSLIQPHAAYLERNALDNHHMALRHVEGRALVRAGRHREAITALRKGLRAAERIGNVQMVAEINHQIMHAFEGLGDWVQAARASERFIASAQLTPDPGVRVISYHDAGGIRWKAGWRAAADSLSRLMVAAIDRERTHHAFAAEYFERIGDFGRAMSYLRLAAVPTRQGVLADPKQMFAGLTRLHLALGNTDSALATARSHDRVTDTEDEILVPRVLVARNQPAQAILAMRRWSRLQADRGNVRGQVKALASLAELLVAAAPAEAIAVAHEVEPLARAHGFTYEIIVALRVRGQATHTLRLSGSAALLEVARVLSRSHPDVMQQILVEVALADALSSEARHGASQMAYGRAIELIERSAGTAHDDVTAARFRAARIQAFNGALRTVLASASPSARADSVLLWSARKKWIQRPGSLQTPPGARAIQGSLRDDEALLDYVVVDTAIWVTVVTRRRTSAHRLPMSVASVDVLTRSIVNPMTSVFGGRLDLARAPFDRGGAARLYEGLLGPVAAHLAGARHLIVVPDAPLHAVPFEALVTSASAAMATYVLDRWTIRYALVAGAGAGTRSIAPSDALLLVVGDAPGAEAERNSIRTKWRTVEVLDAGRGSETNIRIQARAYPILHVASHARSDERNPLASHLELAADTLHDGLLHYAEIEHARVAHALVVLNACETSSGALLPGSGFMSLARAFLVAGSSAVIATQWPVGAASATLSAHFYDHARRGASLHESLHRAKVALRRDPATAHPFFWASHVLLQSHFGVKQGRQR